MQQVVNEAYAPLFTKSGNIRYVILMGGRGAGRSTVASQFALAKLKAPEYFRCAIMRFILSDVRDSIFREIDDRVEETQSTDVTVRDLSFECGKNTINGKGFRKSSGDQKSKLKSLANYNCIIIEEADEIPESDFMQLDDSLRTVKSEITVILLLNPPPRTHWIIRRWFDLDQSEASGFYIPKLKETATDTIYIRTSYLDNIVNISEQTRKQYEEYQTSKPEHYWNMIRGYVPEVVKGKIYSGWKIIDTVPHEARLVGRWLDFGYSNDPTSCGDVYDYNGGLILDEQIYQKGMLNHQIAAVLKGLKPTITVADSSEPKSIDEIRLYGVSITGADKGADSIKKGIDVVQSIPISITARSTNTITEYENYAWYEDKDGTRLNEPKGGFDHSMDGIRYVINFLKPQHKQAETYQEEEDVGTLYGRIGV